MKKNISKVDCNICASSVSSRRIIECPFCKFSACSDCVKTFLIGLEDIDPRCMSPDCKKIWNHDFMTETFEKSFHNKKYRDRRADILIQQQKAMLPATQFVVENRIHNEKINKQIADLEDENSLLMNLIRKNKQRIYRLAMDRIIDENREEKSDRRQFIRACPKNDCKGYLSTALKCGVCEGYACKDCREPKNGKNDPDHKCNPDTIESIKLLASDTKSCPSCSSMVYKISGCDQMYCTQCHTAFSWKTGAIEKGIIHNPHYYEFQRQQNNGVIPRVRGDERCGGIPSIAELRRAGVDDISELNDIFLLHRHIQGHELLRYPTDFDDRIFREMRADYLMNRLSEEKWLSKLKQITKKREKNVAINQVLSMFIRTIGDIFYNICQAGTPIMAEKERSGLYPLLEYTNKALDKIGYQFGGVAPRISEKWVFQTNGKKCKKEKKVITREIEVESDPESVYDSSDSGYESQ